MEQTKLSLDMLELIRQPAFFVRAGKILRTNAAAAQCQIPTDQPVAPLLLTGAEEYEAFTGGCLSLTLSVADIPYAAWVTRAEECDIFLMEEETEKAELHAMALAAQQLREPLSGLMAAADQLFQELPHAPQAPQINQSLHQLLRLVGNMSDAARYAASKVSGMELCNISIFFDELMGSAALLAAQSGHMLEYNGLAQRLHCLINREQIERTVYNLLSNAIKFSPEGTVISARLVRRNSKLCFTLEDRGEGISEQLRGTVFSRFLREPGITDGRFGIGLGLMLVRSAAMNHQGTVLIEQPEGGGTRVTVAFPIRQSSTDTLRSPILTVDYAGEQNHGLIELSDTLPASAYQNI